MGLQDNLASIGGEKGTCANQMDHKGKVLAASLQITAL